MAGIGKKINEARHGKKVRYLIYHITPQITHKLTMEFKEFDLEMLHH